jgi:DNA (cytosine-5)-methyltransferase 1
MVIDVFAGGGGASLGIERALGVPVDLAINHDAEAMVMHWLNHPHTRHDNAEVWSIDPMKAIGGRPVGLAWFSPDCTHFSRAKGGKPVQQKIRSLAWIVVKWARAVHPRVIILENVPEFRDWGPLAEALVRANVQLRDAAVTEAV